MKDWLGRITVLPFVAALLPGCLVSLEEDADTVRVEGQVIDADTGVGIADAEVQAIGIWETDSCDASQCTHEVTGCGRTQADGSYSLQLRHTSVALQEHSFRGATITVSTSGYAVATCSDGETCMMTPCAASAGTCDTAFACSPGQRTVY